MKTRRQITISFQQLLEGRAVTALTYGVQGELFAAVANERIIYQILQNGNIFKEMAIKEVDREDMISFISQNPADPSEISIATIRRNVFIGRDDGESWTKIANKGKTT
ncbi:hypothetical protein [Cohnella sp. JJ-181]|uniref:hypothetical protein n=1 Tax=Cohnella rhizoplanae TaxID=2974897 RepID=UPI00232B1E17|nr:hypothetical protein [Cohnella sp. JJ-181]